MEDSFRVRVDKVFGSLASPSSNTSSSPSPLWCLTDEEIEKKEWKRDRDSPDDDQPKPYPPNLDGFFSNQRNLSSQTQPEDFRSELEADLQDLGDYVDEENDNDNNDDMGKRHRRDSSSRQLVKPDAMDDEEWDIRSSIGLDCTLDYEEEEDEYDKVAVGREKAGDRMYMKDITGCGADDINFYDELPNTFQDITRDPRADHTAAKLRLKEDAEAAGKFDFIVSNNGSCYIGTQNYTAEESVCLKSILERKDNLTDPKSDKRVQFDSQCKYDWEEEYGEAEDVMESCFAEESKTPEASLHPQQCSGVPDYIRNPSKYTHYTFDSSSDIEEKSNQQACLDFLNQLKRSNNFEGQADEAFIDLPKSITFTPKKMFTNNLTVTGNNEMIKSQVEARREFLPKKNWIFGIGIAAQEEVEICAMEEDTEKATAQNSRLQRQGRQYRTKTNRGSDEPAT
ncbi:hypothetical protein NMG60_11006912 [Bertholletia excelsa]